MSETEISDWHFPAMTERNVMPNLLFAPASFHLLGAIGTFRDAPNTAELDNQQWPASPEDLLPHGLDNSVDGLDLWAAEPDGHVIYLLFWGLVNLCHPFAEASIRPPDYPFALRRPLKVFEVTLDSYAGRAPAIYVYDYHLEAAVRNVIRFWGMDAMHNPGGRFSKMMATEGDVPPPVLARLSKFAYGVHG